MESIFKYKFYTITALVFLLSVANAYSKFWAFGSEKEMAYLLSKHEKVFVNLDNSLYISGETIYYKAFIVNASTNQKELQSKIVYYELVNNTGKRYMFWRSNTLNGIASGSILIPDTIPGGIYTLRAYTNWMRNNSDAFYYATNVFITKLSDKDLKKITLPLPFNTNEGELEFIPEGGHLTTNLPCIVGVRVNANSANLYSYEGVVKNNLDSVVAQFKTDTFGLANFSFSPVQNHTYRVIVNKDNVFYKEYQLPVATDKGFHMNVTKSAESISLSIECATEPSVSEGPYRLIFVLKGKVLKDTSLWIKSNLKPIVINTKNSRSGIADICILNKYKEPVFEKLIYCNADVNSILNVNSYKKEFSKGENVSLILQPNFLEETDTLHLSVNITSKHDFPFIGANFSAKPYLDFFSEIASSYCFPNYNDSFSTELADKYLLSIKPEEYYWNNIQKVGKKDCYYLSEDKGYIFSGKLTNGVTGLPITDQAVCLSFADSIPSLTYALTDTFGKFNVLLSSQYDNKDLMLQVVNPQNNDIVYKWELDNKNGKHATNVISNYELNYSDGLYLANFRKIKLINKIFSVDEKKDAIAAKKQKNPAKQNFQLMRSYKVFPSDYIDLANFQEITENIMPGVKMKRNDRETNVYIYDPDARLSLQYPATVLLNGIPFYDLEYIADIEAKEINRIDVNQSQVMFGDLTFYGIVSIITNEIKIPNTYINSSNILVRNEAKSDINTIKKLMQNNSNSNVDLQTLLFLNQSLSIYSNKREIIETKTSNLQDKYNISIQGITNSGSVVSENLKFEVK